MTVTTPHPQARNPNGHATFGADVDVAAATIHAHGTLELFTVDLLQGAIDLLTATGCTGCTDITLDLSDVSSIDHAAVWWIAETSCAMASRHARLTITHARDAVQAALGDLRRTPADPPKENPMVSPDNQTTPPTDASPSSPVPDTTSPGHDPTEQDDHVNDQARDEEQTDVMGGPEQPPAEDVMGGPSQPPADTDVMAPHGGAERPDS
jgi:hypothetical protein